MNTKTVKEKVEKIVVSYMKSLTCNSLYVPIKVLDKIDKLYRKEITKEVVNMPIDLGRFGYGDSLVTVVTKTIRQVEEGLKKEKWVGEIKYHALPERRKLKSIYEEQSSHTCCNIEVNEKKGSEVMCPECKEWITTK